MKKQLAEILGIDLQVINKLNENYLIDPRALSRFIIVEEYKDIKKTNPNRSNTDIYIELSIKHKVSESAIYKWVKSYL
jgi:hypothetical protein